MSPAPKPSPVPVAAASAEAEPETGPHPIYVPSKRDLKKGLKKVSNLSTAKAAVGAIISSIAVGWFGYGKVEALAQERAEKAVETVAQKAKATQEDLDGYKQGTNNRLDHLEHQGNRTEKKLDAIIDAMRIPNPAPAPKDGGP
jgi:hypothetical protein